MKFYSILLLSALVAGCATSNPPPTIVHQPMSVRPTADLAAQPAADGSIFNNAAGAKRMALFEDRRSARLGDIITVVIEERISASSKANTSSSRSGGISAKGSVGADGIPLFPDKLEQLMGVNASVNNGLDNSGEGQTSSSNTFSGTITVTVVDVLANGNVLVSGEKQLAVNSEVEYLRFSGIVNPDDIRAGNTVTSLKVADARLEHRGAGSIARAQEPGWLSRFFQSVLPF